MFFVIGLLGALWSASGYVAAFMRASNRIYDIEEGRPVWKTLPTRVIRTLVLLVPLAVSAVQSRSAAVWPRRSVQCSA